MMTNPYLVEVIRFVTILFLIDAIILVAIIFATLRWGKHHFGDRSDATVAGKPDGEKQQSPSGPYLGELGENK